jgi:hypothetical protein
LREPTVHVEAVQVHHVESLGTGHLGQPICKRAAIVLEEDVRATRHEAAQLIRYEPDPRRLAPDRYGLRNPRELFRKSLPRLRSGGLGRLMRTTRITEEEYVEFLL